MASEAIEQLATINELETDRSIDDNYQLKSRSLPVRFGRKLADSHPINDTRRAGIDGMLTGEPEEHQEPMELQMPIHLNDLDVVSEVAGLASALIVPCNMCPAATVAVRDGKPFMQFFKSLLKSAPFERYIKALQSRLEENGVHSEVFRSRLYHHWFLCMWTAARRKKLEKYAKQYDAVIVLGCGSATETVRDSVQSSDCKVIEGMEVASIMNARLRFHLPCNVSFEDCKITPIFGQSQDEDEVC